MRSGVEEVEARMSALLSAVGSAHTARSGGLAHPVAELGSTDQTWPDLLTIHYCRAGLRRQERQGGWVTGGEGKLGFRHFGRLAFRKHHDPLGKQTLCQLSYSRSGGGGTVPCAREVTTLLYQQAVFAVSSARLASEVLSCPRSASALEWSPLIASVIAFSRV